MRRTLPLAAVLLVTPALAAWFSAPEAAPDSLHGMWSQTEAVKTGDPVRFYYFHPGSIGLFRYGRMGLTYTKSFHYTVEEDVVAITFLKSGETHRVKYELRGSPKALVLHGDPVMGGDQTYRLKPPAASVATAEHPLSRMWTHKTKDGQGQEGFHMYQLQAPALDGRGVGWYHEGDFREWSTETLHYRKTGAQFFLTYDLRAETHVTTLTLGEDAQGRYFELAEDPRNFWHGRRYGDGGPGFSLTLETEPMPYFVPGHGAGHGGGHGAHGTKRDPHHVPTPAEEGCPHAF